MTHDQRLATALTYAASGVTVLFGLTLTEWGVVIGMIVAVATFAMNFWFRHKHLAMERERIAAEIEHMRAGKS